MWVSGLYSKGLLKVTESIKHKELKTTCLWRLYISKKNKDIFSLILYFPKVTKNLKFGCPPPSPAHCSGHHLPLCMGDRTQQPTGCCWDRAATSAAAQAWGCPGEQLTACFPKPPGSASQNCWAQRFFPDLLTLQFTYLCKAAKNMLRTAMPTSYLYCTYFYC